MNRLYSLALLALYLLGSATTGFSQTTLSSTSIFSNNNGSGTVTFNLQNTNSYGIIVTSISGVTGSSGSVPVEVYYKTTPVNGTPGAISAANGWVLAASGTITGVANTTTTTTQTFLTGMNLLIPAGSTYGIAVYALGQRYYTIAVSTPISAGGVNMLYGTNISYGGGTPPAAPTNTPRGWIGSLTFISAVPTAPNCLASPAAPTNNSTTVCSGSTTLRWAKVASATGYDVYLNSGSGPANTLVSSNQTDTFYNATTNVGQYTWKVIPRNAVGPATGCSEWTFTTLPSLTPSVTVSVNPNDSICAGTVSLFTATPTNGGTSPTYQWKKNSTNVGTNSPTYTDASIANNDTIRVEMSSSLPGCLTVPKATSAAIRMTVFSVPSATISAGGPTAFCYGGSVRLTAQAGGLAYEWLHNGIPLAGATAQTYTATYSGIFRARIKTTAFCPSLSDSVKVTVFSTPFPNVDRNGNVLSTAPAYMSYQWYRNNVAIPGATANTYTVTRDGQYKVAVTDTTACSGTSVSVPVNSLGVASISANEVSIFPNPAQAVVNISSPAPLHVLLRSIDGKIVLNEQSTTQINVQALGEGVYLLYLYDRDDQFIKVEKLIRSYR